MTALLERIKERGHWRTSVRPAVFEPKRIASLQTLEDIYREAHVELRGWDYPHTPGKGVERKADYVAGSADWQHHRELWRLYQSGQFIHYFAMWEDWYAEPEMVRRYKPREVLSLVGTLYTMTEFFLFASRLCEKAALGPNVTVSYRLFGLSGRHLQVLEPGRVPLSPNRRAALELLDFGSEDSYRVDDLIARAADIAIDQTLQIYSRFNWDPARASLVEDQRRLLERRF